MRIAQQWKSEEKVDLPMCKAVSLDSLAPDDRKWVSRGSIASPSRPQSPDSKDDSISCSARAGQSSLTATQGTQLAYRGGEEYERNGLRSSRHSKNERLQHRMLSQISAVCELWGLGVMRVCCVTGEMTICTRCRYGGRTYLDQCCYVPLNLRNQFFPLAQFLSTCSYLVRHFHSEKVMDHAAISSAIAGRSILPHAMVGPT